MSSTTDPSRPIAAPVSDSRRGGRLFPLFALLIAPWVLRLGLLVERDVVLTGAAMRGFVADALVAVVFWPLLGWLRRLGLGSALAAAALWSALHVANAEHVRVLGALARIEHAHHLTDLTFVAGSATSLARPLAVLVTLATLVVVWWARPRGDVDGRRWARATVIAALGVGIGLAMWPVRPDQPGWAQRDVVLTAALDVVRAPFSKINPSPDTLLGTGASWVDLDGEPRVALGHPGTNVLLVVVEGVSAAHLPSIATRAGLMPTATLDDFDTLARDDHLVFSRFVAQQRQTNRGLYALLCGEPPALDGGRARMARAATAPGPVDCLPRRLGALGYRTTYLQAAPLAFQRKDAFMPKAGFDEVLGAASFGETAARTPWGVDDRTLFARATTLIDTLETTVGHPSHQPWFLTVMTVGTHHPFLVPGAPPEHDTTRAFARALDFVDDALGAFVEDLEDRGITDSTLVIVTSDESSGLGLGSRLGDEAGGTVDREAGETLRQAWGLLTVRLPGPSAAPDVVDQAFAQSDLAISVLDYLGATSTLAAAGSPLGGRSVFRQYATARPVPFANAYRRRVGVLLGDRVRLCDARIEGCRSFVLGPFGLDAPRPSPHAADDALTSVLHRASGAPSRHRLATADQPPTPRWWAPLTMVATVPIEAGVDRALIDARYRLPARTRAVIDLELVRTGPGSMPLRHTLALGDDIFLVDLPPLIDGDRLVLRTEAHTGPRPVADAFVGLTASAVPDAAGRWTLHRASIDVTPAISARREGPSARLDTGYILRRGRRIPLSPLVRTRAGTGPSP